MAPSPRCPSRLTVCRGPSTSAGSKLDPRGLLVTLSRVYQLPYLVALVSGRHGVWPASGGFTLSDPDA
jgi:hypothetical protein